MVDNSMLKTGSGTKLFALVATVIMVSMAIYNWAISPQTRYIKAVQQCEIVAKNTEQKKLVLERTVKRKQQELEQLKVDLIEAEVPLFDGQTALALLTNIQLLAVEAGCAVDSLNYMSPEIIEFSGLIVLERRAEISLKGRYENITEFMKKIGGDEKKVFISDMDLAVSHDFMTMTCSMDITIYSLEGNTNP
jgi:Tfp pilus assembly protein PilO